MVQIVSWCADATAWQMESRQRHGTCIIPSTHFFLVDSKEEGAISSHPQIGLTVPSQCNEQHDFDVKENKHLLWKTLEALAAKLEANTKATGEDLENSRDIAQTDECMAENTHLQREAESLENYDDVQASVHCEKKAEQVEKEVHRLENDIAEHVIGEDNLNEHDVSHHHVEENIRIDLAPA